MAYLTGSQTEQLQAALLDAFDGAELTQMVKIELGEDLGGIAGTGALDAVVFRLIQWAERRERTGDLLRGARAQRPGNSVFAALAGELGSAANPAPPQPAPVAPSAKAGGINIGSIDAVNVAGAQWIDQRGAVINTGNQTHIDTGGAAYVGGSVTIGSGTFVGRDQITHDAGELAAALAPLVAAVQQDANPAAEAAALQAIEELKAELAKGKHADDSRVAKILDGLANLVPGAVAAVVGAFGTPLLSGIAGPVTQFVLEQLKRR